MVVGGNTDASTQVAHDEAQVLIFLSHLVGIAARDSPLVESVPNAHTRHQRRTAHTCQRREFVHHARIGNKAAAVGDVLCHFPRNEATQVASVFVERFACVGHHFLIHGVDSARNRFCQSPSRNDGIEVERHLHGAQFVENQLFAEPVLIGQFGILL